MISHCPHCGRLVSREEWLVKTRLGWIPTTCAAGDGPAACLGSERIRNHSNFYCTVKDGKRSGFLLGPYPTYEDAEYHLPTAKKKAHDSDHRSAWYAYGIASSEYEIKTVFGK